MEVKDAVKIPKFSITMVVDVNNFKSALKHF